MAVFGLPIAARGRRAAGGPRGGRHAGRPARAQRRRSSERGASGCATTSASTPARWWPATPALGQRLVTGDAVNTAARLEQAAGAERDPPRRADLPPRARRGRGRADRAARAQGQGRAGAGVPAGRGARPPATRAARRRRPMVGREPEMARLARRFAGARPRPRAARLITVIGDAGVGKSRLIREFLGRSRDEAARRPRPLPAVRRRHHVLAAGRDRPRGGRDRRRGPAGRAAADRGLLPARRADDRRRRRPGRRRRSACRDARSRSRSCSGASAGCSRRWPRARPLVVVIDDIHWAEPTLPRPPRAPGRRRPMASPVLILCTARHELLERARRRGPSTPAQTRIVLGPLSDADAGADRRGAARRPGSPRTCATRIASGGRGQPAVRRAARSRCSSTTGAAAPGRGRWAADDELSEHRPSRRRSRRSLAARLDALGREERAVIEPASVIGLVVRAEPAVEASRPRPLRPEIADAPRRRSIGKQLVRRARRPLDDDATYRFHHILIRDAAYDGLLKRARADLHERFVAWAERVNAERGRATWSSRRSSATTSSRRTATGPSSGRSTSTASSWACGPPSELGSAGRRAFARGDMPAAANLLRRAAAALPTTTRHGRAPHRGRRGAGIELGEFADRRRRSRTRPIESPRRSATRPGGHRPLGLSISTT